MRIVIAVAVVVIAAAMAAPAGAVPSRLAQLPGPGGCIALVVSTGCGDGAGLNGVQSLAVSPDGKHVYAVASTDKALVVFARHANTGALTQLVCPACAAATFAAPGSIAIAPLGDHVYVVNGEPGNSIAVFSRDAASGALAEIPSAPLALDPALRNPRNAVVSPNGAQVYVTAEGIHQTVPGAAGLLTGDDSALVVLTRNVASGALTFKECFNVLGDGPCAAKPPAGNELRGAWGVALDPTGSRVYATGQLGNGVVAFSRATDGSLTKVGCARQILTGDSACAPAPGLRGARGLTVSEDGKHLYVAGGLSNAVSILDPGTLANAGCIGQDGADFGVPDACAPGKALDGAIALAIEPGGEHVYVASRGSNAVAVLLRDAATGALGQATTQDGCVSEFGSLGACLDGRGLSSPRGIALGGNGAFVYVASSASHAVTAFAREPIPPAMPEPLPESPPVVVTVLPAAAEPAAPKPAALPSARDVIRLPSPRRCVGKELRVVLRRPAGLELIVAEVRINRRTAKALAGSQIGSRIVVRRIPRGRFVVRVVLTTADERQLSLSQTFRSCKRKAAKKKPQKRPAKHR